MKIFNLVNHNNSNNPFVLLAGKLAMLVCVLSLNAGGGSGGGLVSGRKLSKKNSKNNPSQPQPQPQPSEREYVRERFRGKVTGYQTLEYVQRGIPKPDSITELLGERPVINLGSTTTGVLYKIEGEFPPNPQIPVFADFQNVSGPPVIDDANWEAYGMFIVNAFHGKNFLDDTAAFPQDTNYLGATTSAHALITICETHLLFGGCSTFLHGGELKYPNGFVAIDENGAAFFQTLNGMMLSGLGVDLNIIPNTLTEYPNLNPAFLNEVKYMGSAISGTGASGFDIQRDRKGHVDLRYNAFPYPKDFVNVTENQQGYYSALAFGTVQEFADAYKTGSITRQCRDFEMYSYKLTYDDVDEFLTMASVYDRLVPAEARVNNARDGSFRTIPPSGSPERRDLIDSYLSKRYV